VTPERAIVAGFNVLNVVYRLILRKSLRHWLGIDSTT
jgi:hypothetical protein